MADTPRTTAGITWRLGFTGEPLQSKTSVPVCQDGPELAPVDPLTAEWSKLHFQIPADGREVFLPPLEPERVYQITIEGTCSYVERTKPAALDALYRTDKAGNFTERHHALNFCVRPFNSFLEDREAHQYSFRVDGTTERISATFNPSVCRPRGCLTLTIELLPVGTESPNVLAEALREQIRKKVERALEQAANEKAEQERVACERKVEKEKAALRTKLDDEIAGVKKKLPALACRAHRESNFLDANFQKRYAEHHRERILSKLQPEWDREYDGLILQPEFKRLAEEEAPQVLRWLEARVKIAQLAEQAIVAPPPAFKEMSAEEAEAKMIREKAIEHRKKIALAKLKGENVAEGDAVLESLPLESDLKERLKTELTDSILDDEGEHERRKTDVTL